MIVMETVFKGGSNYYIIYTDYAYILLYLDIIVEHNIILSTRL